VPQDVERELVVFGLRLSRSMDCIHRLHDDVLKVWNFYDPTEFSHRVSSVVTDAHVGDQLFY